MGGAQFRSYWLARGLARYTSHEVSFLVYDYGQRAHEIVDGVHLVRSQSKRKPVHFTRIVHYLRKLQDYFRKTMAGSISFEEYYGHYLPGLDFAEARYDAWLLFGLNSGSLDISRKLASTGAKQVFFLTHDEDVASFITSGTTHTTRHGQPASDVWHIIRENTVFIAQNEYQHNRLTADFGKRSLLIKNPVNLENARPSTREFILWVGRDHEIKRPLLFLELAQRLPQQQFVMILNASSDGAFKYILANKPQNLKLIEQVPLDSIEQEYFSKALLFVSTAASEGFPNTFLQAAKFSVPVLSMNVDPFGYIREYHCGEVGFASVEEMAKKTDSIIKDPALLDNMGKRHYEYVSQNHDLQKIVFSLDNLLQEVIKR